MTLEGWGYLPLLYSHFIFFRLKVSHEQIFISIIKWEWAGINLVVVWILLGLQSKNRSFGSWLSCLWSEHFSYVGSCCSSRCKVLAPGFVCRRWKILILAGVLVARDLVLAVHAEAKSNRCLNSCAQFYISRWIWFSRCVRARHLASSPLQFCDFLAVPDFRFTAVFATPGPSSGRQPMFIFLAFCARPQDRALVRRPDLFGSDFSARASSLSQL
jgi:hypothetical protein